MKRALCTLAAFLAFLGDVGTGSVASSAFAQSKPDSSPSDTRAQNEPKTKEQLEAQQHFQRAKDLYQTGSYREAIAELESARLLDPKAKDLVFNLGIVHEKLGRFDEAIAFFRQYMEMEGVTSSERGKAENIIRRIEGAKREVPVKPATVAPAPADPAPSEPPDTRRGRIDTLTIVPGAIAVVGLGVGTAFGILALSNQPSKNYVTGTDGTYDDLKSQTDTAHTQAVIADVGLGVGVLAAAITAYLYFGRTKEPPKQSFAPSVAPVASGGVLMLGGAFQ